MPGRAICSALRGWRRSNHSSVLEIQVADDLANLCALATPEGISLEFKEKEDRSTPELSRGDRRSIAEAVTAFANSDGGTLIFGMRSEKRQGVDVASEIQPISNVAACRSLVELVAATNVAPTPRNLTVHTIEVSAGTGVVVCSLPRSELRPHMCTAQGVHRYLRRGFEGNALMTPTEVRDQILAVRNAILEPVISYPAGGSFSMAQIWISVSLPVVFSLKNIGQALCRNPFLRVKADCALHSHSATFDGALNAWKTTFPDGTLIHVDDRLTCLSVSLNAAVRLDNLEFFFRNDKADLTESVVILPGSANRHLKTVTDKSSLESVEFQLRFGAENAVVDNRTVSFSRTELAKGLLQQHTVQDMYTQNIGAFRSDLVEQFLKS